MTRMIVITIHHQTDQPPAAVDDNFTVQENTPFNGNVLNNDSDPDGDHITAHLASRPVKRHAFAEPQWVIPLHPQCRISRHRFLHLFRQ